MQIWVAYDNIFHWSIWTECPHIGHDGMYEGYDYPYNSKCVYVFDDLIKLLFPDFKWEGKPLEMFLNSTQTIIS